jgi:hypothetical protein
MSGRLPPRAYLVAASVVASLPQAPPAGPQTPIKQVLIVHAGPETFPGNGNFDVGPASR